MRDIRNENETRCPICHMTCQGCGSTCPGCGGKAVVRPMR